jgi:AraC-like DNA-binding protein
VFSYSYPYSDHIDYLQQLAKYAGVEVVNNTILLPERIGTGYIKAIELPNGLQALINECVLIDDVKFKREPALHESYTLRFDELKNLKQLTLQIDEDKLNDEPMVYSSVFLSNSLSEISYTATAGTESRCVNVFFTAQWLKNNIGISNTDDVFKKYFSLKTGSLNFDVLNLPYRQQMDEIFEIKKDEQFDKMMMQNRVMMLLEIFFRRLYANSKNENTNSPINDDTVKRLMMVESLLVHNLSAPPPTIAELSRIAMMSETKLKNVFKIVYGHNIYEYYQKNRMFKARQMLRSKSRSVKETGMALGFKNLSNFTIAYKKEFNLLPSEV